MKEIEHPDLGMGEDVKATSWNKDRDETKPPPRYDMASLRKSVVLNGGGRGILSSFFSNEVTLPFFPVMSLNIQKEEPENSYL